MKKYLLILVGLWFGIYITAATFTAEKFPPAVRGIARVLVIHTLEPVFLQPRRFTFGDGSTTTGATLDGYLAEAKKTSLVDFWTTRIDHFKPIILLNLWLWVLPWLSLYAAAKLLNTVLSVRQLTRQT
ncbi:hypothetical protein [Thiomonas sp.]